MPPVVTGAVVAVIGLNLAHIPIKNMAPTPFDAWVQAITFAEPAVPAVADVDMANLVAQDHVEDFHRAQVAGLAQLGEHAQEAVAGLDAEHRLVRGRQHERGVGEGLVAQAPWPQADPAMLVQDVITMPVQINGKRRAEIQVPADMPASEVEKIALADDAVVKFLAGQPVKKLIVVPGRIINVVV